MSVNSSSFSCAGPKHKNQDSVLTLLNRGNLYISAIADGIGGSKGGDVASENAINTVERYVQSGKILDFRELFSNIKNNLIELSENNVELKKLGTTLSVVVYTGKRIKLAHVGDCRVYHLRNRGIQDRTKDQTEIQHLIDQGIMPRSQMRRYHRKNVLLSSLSAKGSYEIFENEFDVIKGDRVLLVTDGVYRIMTRKKIRDLSLDSENEVELATKIETSVEKIGSIDDYSAVILQFG